MLEIDIQNLILDQLNSAGIFAFRVNTAGIYDEKNKLYRKPSKFTLAGTSDIVGILPNGRFLAIEVKSATGRPTKQQLAFLRKVNSLGGTGFVAKSTDDVKYQLKEYL
jgi:hypothetical protein